MDTQTTTEPMRTFAPEEGTSSVRKGGGPPDDVTNQGIGPQQTDTESLCYKGNECGTRPFGFPTGLGPDGPREIHAVIL